MTDRHNTAIAPQQRVRFTHNGKRRMGRVAGFVNDRLVISDTGYCPAFCLENGGPYGAKWSAIIPCKKVTVVK